MINSITHLHNRDSALVFMRKTPLRERAGPSSENGSSERATILTSSGCCPERSVRIARLVKFDYPCCEIILVEGGSTDETPEICENYRERHPI
ncbi:hypothetical protein AKJ66_00170 [candidate division MSBL1 archaeon SCGC-AAA259E22]|uniref:Glycosyltransferase 2-like domain-containing protein n=1 Tax=candidate division MSBL1 archaeon SCGC-AAA259E22 TaxID=1698265 RepID=A0A133UIL5_9EURY|nr:hypothetical protein AKJ66_00170 [candidate division MSBL1 archaeon SCGC-AAA259E22]